MCVCVYMRAHATYLWTRCGSWFFHSTVWVQGIRLSGRNLYTLRHLVGLDYVFNPVSQSISFDCRNNHHLSIGLLLIDVCQFFFQFFSIVSSTTLLFHFPPIHIVSFSHTVSWTLFISSSHLLFYFSQHIILSWHHCLGMTAFSLCRIFVCIIWAVGLVVLNCFILSFSQNKSIFNRYYLYFYISPSILKKFTRYSCLGQQFTFKAEVYIWKALLSWLLEYLLKSWCYPHEFSFIIEFIFFCCSFSYFSFLCMPRIFN